MVVRNGASLRRAFARAGCSFNPRVFVGAGARASRRPARKCRLCVNATGLSFMRVMPASALAARTARCGEYHHEGRQHMLKHVGEESRIFT